MRKPAFCINKGAHQLHSNRAADQLLCLCYSDSTIPLLPKYEISSLYLSYGLYSPVCVRPGRKTQRQVFSCSSYPNYLCKVLIAAMLMSDHVTPDEILFTARTLSLHRQDMYVFLPLLGQEALCQTCDVGLHVTSRVVAANCCLCGNLK